MPALSGKPLHVPLGGTLDVPDGDFKALEVESGNGVEGHVEEDERPLEEGVDGVCCGQALGE